MPHCPTKSRPVTDAPARGAFVPSVRHHAWLVQIIQFDSFIETSFASLNTLEVRWGTRGSGGLVYLGRTFPPMLKLRKQSSGAKESIALSLPCQESLRRRQADLPEESE